MKAVNSSCVLGKKPLYSYGSELTIEEGDLEA